MSHFLLQSEGDIHEKHVQLDRWEKSRLSAASSDEPSQWSYLPREVTASRNRVSNAEPFANNRIKLEVQKGVNDYINASPIRLGARTYIATQGPTKATVGHFYRMLAAETRSPAIVVMLTQTHEHGKEACFQYFPDTESDSPMAIPVDDEFHDGFQGSVVLESLTEDSATQSQIRRLRLTTTRDGVTFQELEIVHLLFLNWLNFAIPEGDAQQALVRLVRKAASSNFTTTSKSEKSAVKAHENPLVVHCSAGCGRTGTFIALEYLFSLLDAGKLEDLPSDRDPVTETVNKLREQRMDMVQREVQFQFIYKILRGEMERRKQQPHTEL